MAAPPLSRDAFDLDPDLIWVAHCADGPLPRRASAAAAEVMAVKTRPWELDWRRDMLGIPSRLKDEAARLVAARAADISLTANTSTGLATLAQGFPWRRGDEVLLPLGEFPSNYWPWRALAARGVDLREVPLWDGHAAGESAWSSPPPPLEVDPEARLLAALGPRTRILAVSWVRFQDGLRLDIAKLGRGCRDAGVDLVVDGIQGAGTLAVELESPAAFVTGGHKGLLGPHGQGFVWTDRDFRERMAPPGGWLTVDDFGDFTRPSTDFERNWAADAARLDSGLPNLAGCAALTEAVGLINASGVAAIADHVFALQQRLLSALLRQPPLADEATRLLGLLQRQKLGSILSFHHRGTGAKALLELERRGRDVGIYTTVREGYLRIALHGWHTAADLERILDWLAGAR